MTLDIGANLFWLGLAGGVVYLIVRWWGYRAGRRL